MFCTHCGKEVPEDVRFCPHCSAELVSQEEKENTQAELQTPSEEAECVQSEVQAEQLEGANASSTPDERFFLNTQPDGQPEGTPKKKKIGLIAALSAAAVAVISIVMAIILNWNAIDCFFARTFGSAKDYMESVELYAAQSDFASVSKLYSSFTASTANSSAASQVDIKLHMSDTVQQVLETLLRQQNMDMDLDFLSDATIRIDANRKDSLTHGTIHLDLGNHDIVSIDVYVDQESMTCWYGIPELTDKYLKMDLKSALSEAEFAQMQAQMRTLGELTEQLPSGEALEKLLNKYYSIALKQVSKVEKSTQTVELQDVKQKLTVLEIKITEKDLLDMAIEILREAKDDREILDILEAIEQSGLLGSSDLSFDDGIDQALASLKAQKRDASDDNYLLLRDYVDGSSRIVGREITVYPGDHIDGRRIGSYITVTKGDKFASEIDFSGLKITGSGTQKGSQRNGEFAISVEEHHILDLTLIDWDEKKSEKGMLDGTIRLSPTPELLGIMNLPEQISSVISSSDGALELVFRSEKKTQQFSINLVSSDVTIIGLEISAKEVSSKKITLPTNTVDMTNPSELMRWVYGMRFDELLSRMQQAGVPDKITQLITYYLEQNGLA